CAVLSADALVYSFQTSRLQIRSLLHPSPSPLLLLFLFFSTHRRPPTPTLFPYTTLFRSGPHRRTRFGCAAGRHERNDGARRRQRSEEHTSELQSRRDLVCRLLLEKKKKDSKVK